MTILNDGSSEPAEVVAGISKADGKLKDNSFESYMDLLAIYGHTTRRFKTGELVIDKE